MEGDRFGYLTGAFVALVVGGLYLQTYRDPQRNAVTRAIGRWTAKPAFRGFFRDPHREILFVALLSLSLAAIGFFLAVIGTPAGWGRGGTPW